ncbi:MAG: phosphatase PAP2 family protein [Bacteroidota bacterium]
MQTAISSPVPVMRRFSIIWIFVVGLAVFRSYGLAQSGEGGLDARLFRSINNSRSSLLDHLIDFTDNAAVPVGVALPAGFAVYGIAADHRYERVSAYMIGASAAVATLITWGTKQLVKRERPYISLQNVHVSHVESGGSYSFPSGHSTFAFAIATAISLRYPKPLVIASVYTWAGLVAYGRVYLGLHYPGDVLGGALVGSASALTLKFFSKEFDQLDRKIFGDDNVRRRQTQSNPISSRLENKEERVENVSLVVIPSVDGAFVNITVHF